MALFNPFQVVIFPFLFLVALPLALCAGLTTILAFMVLFLRLFLVYFDVGLETVRYILVGHAAHTRSVTARQASSIPQPLPLDHSLSSSPEPRHRRRRKTQGSTSSGSITPVNSLDGFALTPTIGVERDFEGVGGWRLDSVDVDADAADDRQWYNLNSRLDLLDRRHHFRSQSGGAVSGTNGLGLYVKGPNTSAAFNSEGPRIYTSPNSSRSRTPTSSRPRGFTKLDGDEYFPTLEGKYMKNGRV
ncbi:uncharacterized protein GGS22DRAFT_150608 [Annulohypoxylon maeteangense]|uniref:uncharacterized protein n=1 Tax=Annulohypoxylon maeteangense TaxID=1927788 RepID=UPI0020085B53|nr:uncharacterized protein GGS22DRAFT_150608 [Annulohypoxylon maeteangense]KAI0890330.1 hypothetical protein GGS22DRAFT_150608 [Annulohypoxylon maeteangense]